MKISFSARCPFGVLFPVTTTGSDCYGIDRGKLRGWKWKYQSGATPSAVAGLRHCNEFPVPHGDPGELDNASSFDHRPKRICGHCIGSNLWVAQRADSVAVVPLLMYRRALLKQ